jgi:hypothetical protein
MSFDHYTTYFVPCFVIVVAVVGIGLTSVIDVLRLIGAATGHALECAQAFARSRDARSSRGRGASPLGGSLRLVSSATSRPVVTAE